MRRIIHILSETMNSVMTKYIYEYEKWPDFTWDDKQISVILGKVRHFQGKIFGQMDALGFSMKEETMLSTLTLDVLKSSEIEGEFLNFNQVRSSIARRLGINYAGITHSHRDVEGVVEMMLDATQNFDKPNSQERIFGGMLLYSQRVGVVCIELSLENIEPKKCKWFQELSAGKKYTTKHLHHRFLQKKWMFS